MRTEGEISQKEDSNINHKARSNAEEREVLLVVIFVNAYLNIENKVIK